MLILSKYLRRNKALLAKLHSRLQPPLSKPHSKSCCPHPSHPYHASRASGWSEAVPVPKTHLLHSSTSAGWLRSDSSPGSSSPPARARGTRAACCLWLSATLSDSHDLLLAKRGTWGRPGDGSTWILGPSVIRNPACLHLPFSSKFCPSFQVFTVYSPVYSSHMPTVSAIWSTPSHLQGFKISRRSTWWLKPAYKPFSLFFPD